MIEALETLLKDLMQNFNDFGIRDDNGDEFQPQNFNADNLKPFKLDVSTSEMVAHSSLPFYDPACDGIQDNEETQRLIRQSAVKWVDATQHPYTINVGKVMWNSALYTLNELKEVIDAHKQSIGALGTKLFSLYWNKTTHQKVMNDNAAYLDNSRVIETAGVEAQIRYYVIPRVVDQRTLAFAKSTLRLMQSILSHPDPFASLNAIIPASTPDKIREFITSRQRKTAIGLKIGQPKLMDRMARYEARKNQHDQSDADRESLLFRMDELRLRAIATREKYKTDLATYIEHALSNLDSDNPDGTETTFENKMAKVRSLIAEVNDTDYLSELQPEYRFQKGYQTALYQDNKPETELISRADIQARKEYETTLAQLFPNKNGLQVIQARQQLKQKLNDLAYRLQSDYEAQQNNEETAVELRNTLLIRNRELAHTVLAKDHEELETEEELRSYNEQFSEAIRRSESTVADTEQKLKSLEESIWQSLNTAWQAALTSGVTFLSRGLSNLSGFFSQQQAAPISDSNLDQKKFDSEEERLREQLRVERENLANLNKPRLAIIDRLGSIKADITSMTQEQSENAKKIKRLSAFIEKRSGDLELIAQQCIDKLDAKIKEQSIALNPKHFNIDTFRSTIPTFFSEINAIKTEFDALKRLVDLGYTTDTLRAQCFAFEYKYAAYPLSNTHIQSAITQLMTEYNDRLMQKRKTLMGRKLNRKTLAIARSLLDINAAFLNTNSPLEFKLKTIARFKRLCNSITLKKNTRIAVCIIIGICIGIAIALSIISGLGIILATGWAAVFAAVLIVKIAAVFATYALGVMGLIVGYAIGESITPKISEAHQRLGLFCRTAAKTLKNSANAAEEQKPDDKPDKRTSPSEGDGMEGGIDLEECFTDTVDSSSMSRELK